MQRSNRGITYDECTEPTEQHSAGKVEEVALENFNLVNDVNVAQVRRKSDATNMLHKHVRKLSENQSNELIPYEIKKRRLSKLANAQKELIDMQMIHLVNFNQKVIVPPGSKHESLGPFAPELPTISSGFPSPLNRSRRHSRALDSRISILANMSPDTTVLAGAANIDEAEVESVPEATAGEENETVDVFVVDSGRKLKHDPSVNVGRLQALSSKIVASQQLLD